MTFNYEMKYSPFFIWPEEKNLPVGEVYPVVAKSWPLQLSCQQPYVFLAGPDYRNALEEPKVGARFCGGRSVDVTSDVLEKKHLLLHDSRLRHGQRNRGSRFRVHHHHLRQYRICNDLDVFDVRPQNTYLHISKDYQ